jgi:hypothetical protein
LAIHCAVFIDESRDSLIFGQIRCGVTTTSHLSSHLLSALFRFQNPNNRLTRSRMAVPGWWCIAATLREIRNSMVHFNCGLRPTIVHPKGAVWSQPLKEAGDETSVEP